jgi:hypothetical protein
VAGVLPVVAIPQHLVVVPLHDPFDRPVAPLRALRQHVSLGESPPFVVLRVPVEPARKALHTLVFHVRRHGTAVRGWWFVTQKNN